MTQAAQAPTGVSAGERTKARDLIEAIRTLKLVELEGRPATAGERLVMSRFCGFGPVALHIFPDPVTRTYRDGWERLGRELLGLLTPTEYMSVRASVFNAFYTSGPVMRHIFAGLQRLGLPDTARVLEPGCGIGGFISQALVGMRFIGVELDVISGRIAQLLYPDHDIRIENFRDSRLPAVDGVVGNVPFGRVTFDYKKQKLSLHDYFIVRSLAALRPGGLLGVVTSRFTLDRQDSVARQTMADLASLVGAVRLPSTAFQREGTRVVTDILFMRRHAKTDTPETAPAWLETSPLPLEGGDPIPVNRYFLDHPGRVLGQWSRQHALHHSGLSVDATGDLEQQLEESLAWLDAPAATTVVTSVPVDAPPASPTVVVPKLPHIVEGSLWVAADQTIQQVVDGEAEAVVYGGTALRANGTLVGRRIGCLIGLRDAARRVLTTQNERQPEDQRDAARADLNRLYDGFVETYGPINRTTFHATKTEGADVRRMPNLARFRDDPDAMLVMALEEYDEASGTARKAAILQRDVVGDHEAVVEVETSEQGLLVCLDQRGHVDLPYVGQLSGRSVEQVEDELGRLIYRDPVTRAWQTADHYCSGNVRRKLLEAKAAGGPFERNVQALLACQPTDILPGEIDANLGAPWIPVKDIRAFAGHLFRVPDDSFVVAHLAKDAVWTVQPNWRASTSVASTADYGTPRVDGISLFEQALNLRQPTVYDTIFVDGREERHVNHDATVAARDKQRIIKDKFRRWLFSEPARAERLVRRYNDTYNCLQVRSFDGSHLSFPGMSQAVQLNPHQKNAIWRIISGGNTLLAHVVGSGKTFAQSAAVMKLKQCGLAKKPMIIAPNHMLEQFSREFLHLYPDARLLVATKDDLSKDRRKRLTARIAAGEWDAIVTTHSSFERIGMSREFQRAFIREQLDEYNQLLVDRQKTPRNIIKVLERQKAQHENRLKELSAETKKDDGLTFDELGIDWLFVDESNYGKNLDTPTKMERVAGIQTSGSQRAFDLFMKCRYLDGINPGRGVTFASGTPVSNTMVEMYTIQRYLDLKGLTSRHIDHFDAWAATFGEVVESMEISPDGATLRPRSRFARFINLPELQQMFRSFSDVQTDDMLRLPRPDVAGGGPTVVACDMSEYQAHQQKELVVRYDRLRGGHVDPREDNALLITTDGRKLALDGRLLGGSADFSGSKVNVLIERVVSIHRETAADRLTQMIFCDSGVHANPFSLYEDITRKLIRHGIPTVEIAIMGDADNDQKKHALFERVRAGVVRVLIGSTAKMGMGTNVQKRLVALHHLDAPWKPSEVEQREGRILRQGNDNATVQIYRYVTKGSFDAFMWQALEVKARFIGQVITGRSAVRRADDIGEQELSYAEVKAIASGNPAIVVLAEADGRLQQLAILRRAHLDEQYRTRQQLRELPETIARLERWIESLRIDAATVASNHEELSLDAVVARLLLEPQRLDGNRRFPLGVHRGLRATLLRYPSRNAVVTLEGAAICQDWLREDAGARAALNGLGRLVGQYGYEIDRSRTHLDVSRAQLASHVDRRDQPFPLEDTMDRLTALRDQLRRCLSETAAPEDADRTTALSDQIKQLLSEVSA